MILLLTLIGLVSLGAYLLGEVRQLRKHYRVEFRRSHGKRRVYLRSRKTGRLTFISANIFDLLLKGYDHA